LAPANLLERLGLVFGRNVARKSANTQTVLTEVFRGFIQSF